jgi:preprotein translocase subunit SecE
MNSSSDSASSPLDTAILVLAVLILAASIFGFYYVQGQVNDLVRVVGVLVGAVIAVAVGSQTAIGRLLWAYIKGSRTELRKVVWPTRRNTVQTTLVVIIIVLIIAVFLWGLDTMFGFLVQKFVGRGA